MGRGQRSEDRGQSVACRGLEFSGVPNAPYLCQFQKHYFNSAIDLVVYEKAYALSMRLFALSKKFPTEERYALTSQARRASRSVCLNLREAWAKRRYEAHFLSKLTDRKCASYLR